MHSGCCGWSGCGEGSEGRFVGHNGAPHFTLRTPHSQAWRHSTYQRQISIALLALLETVLAKTHLFRFRLRQEVVLNMFQFRFVLVYSIYNRTLNYSAALPPRPFLVWGAFDTTGSSISSTSSCVRFLEVLPVFFVLLLLLPVAAADC